MKENTDGHLNKIRKMTHEQNKMLIEEIKPLKNQNQTQVLKMNNAMTKLKNLIKNFNSRLGRQNKESANSKANHVKLTW